MGNVQRFRARKVDLRRHMPVYRASELPDLENEDSNRTVDIETGVEKDEEAEHHLQAVISASQAAANGQATKSRLYIPTPSTTKALDDYDRLYPKLFQQPKSLIRTVALYEDIKDNDYCMDEEDEAWLATHNKACAQGALPPATTNTTNTTTTDSSAEPNVPFSQRPLSKSEFEDAMGQLEFLTKHMVFSSEKDIPTLKTLTAYAKERDVEILSNVSVVFDWWKQRKVKREFHQIMPQLLFEDISKTTIDPYVCFRRREVRHGRKTRRADQRSLEHLNRLRLNLLSVAQLLGFCIERETKKSELYAHESTLLAHRSKIISLRRRLGLTEQPFSDLFTLPATQTPSVTSVRRRHTPAQQQLLLDVQPGTVNGAGARNRADSTARRQRQHPGPQSPQPHRVPAIVIPSIPKSLDVSLYSAPQHLLDMVARVQSKVRKYQQDLRDHVDGTFTFKLPSQPSGRQTAQFWSPNVLRFDSQRLQGMSASPQGARNLAFRLRRSPNGWIYLDRRRVLPLCTTPPPQPQLPLSLTALDSDKMQTSSFPELLSRLELYRMGMLTAEDRERLRSLSATSKCPQSLYPDDIPRVTLFSPSVANGGSSAGVSLPSQAQPVTAVPSSPAVATTSPVTRQTVPQPAKPSPLPMSEDHTSRPPMGENKRSRPDGEDVLGSSSSSSVGLATKIAKLESNASPRLSSRQQQQQQQQQQQPLRPQISVTPRAKSRQQASSQSLQAIVKLQGRQQAASHETPTQQQPTVATGGVNSGSGTFSMPSTPSSSSPLNTAPSNKSLLNGGRKLMLNTFSGGGQSPAMITGQPRSTPPTPPPSQNESQRSATADAVVSGNMTRQASMCNGTSSSVGSISFGNRPLPQKQTQQRTPHQGQIAAGGASTK